MKQTKTFTVEAEVPEGFEMTGELRSPQKDEFFLNSDGLPELCYSSFNVHRIILRKTETWRPATVSDIIRALQGATVKARFRDYTDRVWVPGVLAGGVPGSTYSWASRTPYPSGGDMFENFRYCEVLDV
jgi:hypothetical protein